MAARERELAARFRVSLFFIVKLLRQRAHRATVRGKAARRTSQTKTDAGDAALFARRTCRAKRFDFAGIGDAGATTVRCRRVAINRLSGVPGDGVAAQKKTVCATERLSERVRELRIQWQREKQPALAKRQVWFLDETGVSLRLARNYGRAPRGARARGKRAEE